MSLLSVTKGGTQLRCNEMIGDCCCFCGAKPILGLGWTAFTFSADWKKTRIWLFFMNCQRDASSLPTRFVQFHSEIWTSAPWLTVYQTRLPAANICLRSVMPVFFFSKWFYLKSVQKASDTVCTCRHWVPKIRPRSNFFRAIFTFKTPRGCFLKEYAIGVQFKVKWKEKWRLK